MNRALATILACLLVLAASPAGAVETHSLSLNFRLEPGERISHLCVISRLPGKGSIPLSLLDSLKFRSDEPSPPKPKPHGKGLRDRSAIRLRSLLVDSPNHWSDEPSPPSPTTHNRFLRDRSTFWLNPSILLKQHALQWRTNSSDQSILAVFKSFVEAEVATAPPPSAADQPTAAATAEEVAASTRKAREDRLAGLRDTIGAISQMSLDADRVDGSGTDACAATSYPAPCEPHIVLPLEIKDSYMICAANLDGGAAQFGARARVAVVSLAHGTDLGLEGANGVESLRVQGGSAFIGLVGKIHNADVVSVEIVGGHFNPGASYSAAGGQIELPATPLCRPYDVTIPSLSILPDTTLSARVSTDAGDLVCKAIVPRHGHFQMQLPYTTGSKTIRVEESGKHSYPAEEDGVAAFEDSWTSLTPPTPLTLRATVVSFSWARHCLYPRTANPVLRQAECPMARLADPGILCERKRYDEAAKVCYYRCGETTSAQLTTEARASFDLPTRVRFERDSDTGPKSDDAWDDTLTHGNQVLSAYIPRENRYLDLSFKSWIAAAKQRPFYRSQCKHRFDEKTGDALPMPDDVSLSCVVESNGDEIDQIAILSPTGISHAVAPGIGARIPAPGLLCQDTLKYTIFGTRRYAQTDLKVDNGVVVLDPPDKSAEILAFGLALSLGGVAHLFHTNDFNNELDPAVKLQGIAAFRPPASPLSYEARGGYMLSRQVYSPVSASFPANPELAWYHRWSLAGLFVPHLGESFYLGAGPMFIVAHSSSDADKDRVGNIQYYGGLETLVGWVLSGAGRSTSFEVAWTITEGEAVHAHENGGFRGKSTDESIFPMGMFLTAGVRVGRH